MRGGSPFFFLVKPPLDSLEHAGSPKNLSVRPSFHSWVEDLDQGTHPLISDQCMKPFANPPLIHPDHSSFPPKSVYLGRAKTPDRNFLVSFFFLSPLFDGSSLCQDPLQSPWSFSETIVSPEDFFSQPFYVPFF